MDYDKWDGNDTIGQYVVELKAPFAPVRQSRVPLHGSKRNATITISYRFSPDRLSDDAVAEEDETVGGARPIEQVRMPELQGATDDDDDGDAAGRKRHLAKSQSAPARASPRGGSNSLTVPGSSSNEMKRSGSSQSLRQRLTPRFLKKKKKDKKHDSDGDDDHSMGEEDEV